jgi:hypothetical protein
MNNHDCFKFLAKSELSQWVPWRDMGDLGEEEV